ncbi:MAG: hypothetical protein NC299_10730 [Lachnospiraceae bacterium]|nr:hypothetical protein [Ruminococcus sp.]MCM1275822.1 hypothetical protein [Lachnospiraceae bacterium]
MKIGKYPVKPTFRVARAVSDVLSLGIAVLIFSAAINFIAQYRMMLRKIGADAVAAIESEYMSSISWRYWLVLIFPALVVGVFAAYLILTLTSRKLGKFNVTKRTAQDVYDWYAFCVSVCKIPVLMGIFDIMYIFHQRMLGDKTSFFSLQVLLDIIIVAIIIRFTMHRIRKITEKTDSAPPSAEKSVVRVRVADNDDKE